MVVFAVQASHRDDVWKLIVVGQGVDVGVAVAEHTPAGLVSVVAVVDDAHTAVDVLAHSRSIWGRGAAHILVVAVDVGITVIQQIRSDVIDVLIVILAVVTAAACAGGDTLAHAQPGGALVEVALVVQHLVHMVGHLSLVLAAEAANEHFVIAVVADHLTIRQVTIA